ncbi:MAG TPA: tyrosine-type recombinase/integrase, partial [Candidatus Acidoferrum sp.]|nr:tyrosine-type recombinase/integrase [Candidatus Acidoferrum sp.]
MKDARKRKGIWHADFFIDGRRYRQSLHTDNWREASSKIAELKKLAEQGKLTPEAKTFSRLPFPVAVLQWLEEKRPRVAPKTYLTEQERASAPSRYFGQTRLSEITAESVLAYMRERTAAGISNGTVNRELDVIRGTLKRARLWHRMADDAKPLPARSTIGRALSNDEELRLLRVAAKRPEWSNARLAMTLAMHTTMRGCEIRGLQWRDVDFLGRSVTIRHSKTKAGIRTIPLNATAWAAVLELRERIKTFYSGEPQPAWYVFPSGEGQGLTSPLNGATVTPDPTRPMITWRSAWRGLTRAISCPACGELQQPGEACSKCGADIRGVKSPLQGLRFHDLRHHAITKLCESQASDATVMAIAGHVSDEMLRHYSHVRQHAMRRALDALAGGTFEGGAVTNSVTKSDAEPTAEVQVLENHGGREGIRTP